MSKVAFGHHSAIRVRRTDRPQIRRFFGDVLGCKLMRALEDKDDFRLGEDFYIAFLYEGGHAQKVESGVVYAADDPLSADDFLKAIFLELKTDRVDQMRARIVQAGVRVLPVPDPHLYFQAPGGQVFRLVGIDEDLSSYEGNV